MSRLIRSRTVDNLIACRTCLQPKPLAEFSKAAKNKSGYDYSCKLCGIAYRRKWTAMHPKKDASYCKAWRERNPEAKRNAKSKRRVQKFAGGSYKVTAKERTKILAAGCSYCHAAADHIDHVVPISRGGTHSIGNLTGACQRCNLSKHNKFLMEWKGRKQ